MTSQATISLIEGTEAPPAPPSLDENSVLARNKPILLAALAQRGVYSATVTYAGVGDSGGIESLAFEIAEGPALDESAIITVLAQRSQFLDGEWQQFVAEEEVPIERALRDFVDEALELLHGGWEDGEGASGKVIFDCSAATVRIEHMVYFIDSDCVETTL